MIFPTDLSSFLKLIAEHGDAAYSLMFTYATSHSLLFTLFGGYAAHAGAFSFWPLVFVCWAGSFIGDVVRFWIGERFGTRWLKSFPRLQRAMDTAARLAGRHAIWMILLHRYPHGIRGVAGFAYGMSDIGWRVFLFLNFFASGIWAVAMVWAGYAFGQVSASLMDDVSQGLGFGMLVAFLGLSWVLSKKLERVAERG